MHVVQSAGKTVDISGVLSYTWSEPFQRCIKRQTHYSGSNRELNVVLSRRTLDTAQNCLFIGHDFIWRSAGTWSKDLHPTVLAWSVTNISHDLVANGLSTSPVMMEAGNSCEGGIM